MNADSPPPLIRRRDVFKIFHGKLGAQELEDLVDLGIVETYQKTPKSRRYYRTGSIEKILNGGQHAT